MTGTRFAALLATVAVVVGACGGDPILANPPAQVPVEFAPTEPPVAVVDPLPVELPQDDGPHERLTEWWYYTGHLRDGGGGEFGFEYVIFRAERGGFPVSWASHLAVTDESNDRFHYGQRIEIGPQVDRGAANGFDLALVGADPAHPETFTQPPWTMTGANGDDRLAATLTPAEAAAAGVPGGLALELSLAPIKPATLHDEDGWIDFGPAGGSYYYSRTAMTATGSLAVDGREAAVTGSAWFDHQWGDFIAVGGGGWDWFAVNLDDGTDLTFSLVRDADGAYPLVYGTLVSAAGQARHLGREAFTIEVTERWISPHTGADYPAGWRIVVPDEELELELTPTVADQELDTRATTGVVYWEGSQDVEARRAGATLGGEAYVELTGYAGVLAAGP